MIFRAILAALALLSVSWQACAAPPQALIFHTPLDNDAHCAFAGDSVMLLVVSDQNEEIARYHYCSAYGRSSARTYVDERDRRLVYVVIEYGEGRGTSATAHMLKIMRIDGETSTLHELGYVLRTTYDAPASQWQNDYDVKGAPSGGLVVTLHYAPGPAAECCAPPEKQITVRVGP